VADAATRSLPWHLRLETRVIGGVLLLVALSLGAILAVTARTVTNRSLERAASDLDAARSALDRLVTDRAQFATAQAGLVTALPVFRAHMTDSRLAGDAATLTAMAESYRTQLEANFAIVTNHSAQWTATPGWPANVAAPPALQALIRRATAGEPSHDIATIGDSLMLVVAVPARFAEEVLGTLTVGYALDDAFTRQLAEITHAEINLVGDGRLYASSLPRADRAALAPLLSASLPPPGVSLSVDRVGARDYAVGVFPLLAGGAVRPGRVMLLKDWEPTRLFIVEVRNELLIAGVLIFGVAVFAAVVLSRRMTRPLMDLAAAAEDVASGNWERQLPMRGGAEATTMARAFNGMTASLRHWYDHARKRDDELRQAQKLEAIGRLAGGIAHDFNNLLTAIRGYGELLLAQLEPGDSRRDDAGEIVAASVRAANLTRQLLTFSRRQPVAPQVIALDQIVANTRQMLGRLIGDTIDLQTRVTPESWRVRVDPTQIEQVLLNLAVNARDAMPDGGALRIELENVTLGRGPGDGHRTLAPGEYVRLSVADTGCGMTPETMHHIFEPFFTTKGASQGTGLGLATVHGIVEQAGGAIDVESEPGRGTTFHVFLPRTAELEAPSADSAERLEPLGRASETVLVVEDEPRVAALVANALRKTGYTVLEASDAQDAIEIADGHDAAIDLLLTDVVMPGMNGRELATYIQRVRPRTRVLYMSGYSDDAVLQHGIETARVSYLQKPFSLDALSAKVRQVLGE